MLVKWKTVGRVVEVSSQAVTASEEGDPSRIVEVIDGEETRRVAMGELDFEEAIHPSRLDIYAS